MAISSRKDQPPMWMRPYFLSSVRRQNDGITITETFPRHPKWRLHHLHQPRLLPVKRCRSHRHPAGSHQLYQCQLQRRHAAKFQSRWKRFHWLIIHFRITISVHFLPGTPRSWNLRQLVSAQHAPLASEAMPSWCSSCGTLAGSGSPLFNQRMRRIGMRTFSKGHAQRSPLGNQQLLSHQGRLYSIPFWLVWTHRHLRRPSNQFQRKRKQIICFLALIVPSNHTTALLHRKELGSQHLRAAMQMRLAMYTRPLYCALNQ